MKDVYVDAFLSVVKETKEQTGYELPDYIESYIVMLLASNVEHVNFLPEKTFAETYLNLKNHKDAKVLGDTCLFISGVFPDYGSRYGITKEYYISIGSSSYETVSRTLHPKLFSVLSTHFEFVSEFIEHIVNHRKISQNPFIKLL